MFERFARAIIASVVPRPFPQLVVVQIPNREYNTQRSGLLQSNNGNYSRMTL